MTTTRTGTERQTCAACLATVGTLPSGEHRPYVTTRYETDAYGGPPRRFHYCAGAHYVSVAAALDAGARLITYPSSSTPT